jgi:hypothetical protein
VTTITKYRSDFFYGGLAIAAYCAPALLVIAAGTMREGLPRGELIVDGSAVALAAIATALSLRIAYALGFSRALKVTTAGPSAPLMTYG